MALSPQYASEPPAVYTVGHSTRTIPEFVELLNKGPVELVVDIRSVPRSRTNPQFNLDALPEALAAWQIGLYADSRAWRVAEKVEDRAARGQRLLDQSELP